MAKPGRKVNKANHGKRPANAKGRKRKRKKKRVKGDTAVEGAHGETDAELVASDPMASSAMPILAYRMRGPWIAESSG